MIQKEIDSLGYDLKRAKNSMKEVDFKWLSFKWMYQQLSPLLIILTCL